MDFSSKLLENAVNEVSRLPGIGKRTALRLVLHLLKQPKENTTYLTEALLHLRNDEKSMRNVIIFLTLFCVIFVKTQKGIQKLFVWWKILEM